MDINVRDWVVVPVFYRTNRTKLPASGHFSTDDLSRDGSIFGIKNVVVPCPNGVSISDWQADKMDWQLIHLEKPLPTGKKPNLPENCKLSDREMSKPEVMAAFNQYRKSSGQDHVVVFVHGCCATFETSTERAGKIAVNMQVPLIIYDWVSPTGFTSYLKNETLAEQEFDDFSSFLMKLEKFIPVNATSVIGHSMGATFVDSAMVRRFEREHNNRAVGKYDEVIFSNPDIDARSFINHQAEVASNAKQVRIFMSTQDGRLRTSATAHGGYVRLGRPETLLPELCKMPNQDIIDVTAVGAWHEMPFRVIGDLYQTGQLSPQSGFTLTPSGDHLFVLNK